MAIYSGARQRILSGYNKPRGGSVRAVVLHSTAGGASSPYPTFARGSACSHFWVGYDGQIEQFMDTAWKDAADLYNGGGPYVVSIETASNTSGTDAWTSAQLKSIVKLVTWICDHYDIPARQSRYAGDAGIGWHRLGIDGNFPSGLHGGRRQIGRGDVWSTAFGKVCPGDKRIDQVVDSVIPGVLSNLGIGDGGGGTSKPDPRPTQDGNEVDVDGHWGPATTRALQRIQGTHVDGVISGQVKGDWNKDIPSISFGTGGSQLIAAMQKDLARWGHYSGDIDGYLGPNTIKAIQAHEGTTKDGVISDPSQAVTVMQKRINSGNYGGW
jgi:peptidoglycan hydrolase-like protein with peptidoglycan-binding domain